MLFEGNMYESWIRNPQPENKKEKKSSLKPTGHNIKKRHLKVKIQGKTLI